MLWPRLAHRHKHLIPVQSSMTVTICPDPGTLNCLIIPQPGLGALQQQLLEALCRKFGAHVHRRLQRPLVPRDKVKALRDELIRAGIEVIWEQRPILTRK